VDGIPLIHRNIGELRQEVRMVKAALNEFAKTPAHDRIGKATTSLVAFNTARMFSAGAPQSLGPRQTLP
jgi:hypothetical protein